MKKIILQLILLTSFSLTIYSQNIETPQITLEKISDNLYQIQGGRGSNSGMYIADNEVIIIDSKMDKAPVDGIFNAIKQITDKPVTYLINTHSDGDHINGNQFFPQSVTIIAHENCRNEILLPQNDGSPSLWADKDMLPFIPEITFKNNIKLHLDSKTVELYYFGIGHTTGDIVVYFPEEKTAFIGDQAFFGRPQLIHSYKGGDSLEHVKTLNKMLESLDAEKFCSGHNDLVSRTDIKNHLKEITDLQQNVKKLISENKTLEEIKSSFSEDKNRLIESVYNELKAL